MHFPLSNELPAFRSGRLRSVSVLVDGETRSELKVKIKGCDFRAGTVGLAERKQNCHVSHRNRFPLRPGWYLGR